MARTTRRRRAWRVDNSIWFRNWKQESSVFYRDLRKHLKELLVYYPKSIQALKLLALEAHNLNRPEESKEFLSLKKAVLSTAKVIFVRSPILSENKMWLQQLL